jgi:hypothetical protein
LPNDVAYSFIFGCLDYGTSQKVHWVRLRKL